MFGGPQVSGSLVVHNVRLVGALTTNKLLDKLPHSRGINSPRLEEWTRLDRQDITEGAREIRRRLDEGTVHYMFFSLPPAQAQPSRCCFLLAEHNTIHRFPSHK